MADNFSHQDMLAFMDHDERQHYESPNRTEEERKQIKTELEEVWNTIPDPSEAELRQFMGERTWQETQNNISARRLPRAQWKRFRKADARAELEKSQAFEGVFRDIPPEELKKLELQTSPADAPAQDNQDTQSPRSEKTGRFLTKAQAKRQRRKTTKSQQPKSESDEFLEFHREPHGGFALRRVDSEGRTPEDKARAMEIEEEAERLRKREELLKREEQLENRREYDRQSKEMGRDLFGNLVRSQREQRALRKREELLEREERLQQQREQQPEAYSIAREYTQQDIHRAHPEPAANEIASSVPQFERIGESTFSEPSVAEKLWKLTESNFFWGGGVGMALAAYAFEIGGAPHFAVVLLTMGWIVFTVSTFRHGFFERNSKIAKFIYQSLISAIIAVVLIVTWILLHPVTVQPQGLVANVATPTPNIETPLQVLSSPSPILKTSPLTTATQTPALASPTPPASFPSDAKIALLQCNVSENDKEKGYQILREAVCVAKHQQTGQEFIGTIGEEGVASINVPYGFYVVTIKAKGYITRVEAIRVQQDFGNTVSVVLSKQP